MRYRISQLKIDPWDTVRQPLEELLERAVLAEIRRRTGQGGMVVRNLEIIRESVDARKKPDVKLVYTVDFDCEGRLPFDVAKRETYTVPAPASEPDETRSRPVVVGFGPCGMFAALIMAEAGLRPVVIERGKAVN